ncbi:hypothetical protein Ddye_014216 [Dipteronia dyeriana]|uniref:Phorbol-ester/DAG-type domain-containing protein n=1 Tax=Dipteronia dyeriana TaxID=168575 RepID=A0AAD9X7M3_9ROSI|nr:hypothetical protein Ddye_014216 [Dipteronia dyeriana]
MEEIRRSHPGHELKRKSYEQIYKCNGCKEFGIGPGYRCEECNCNLHRECMLPKSEITRHNLFERLIFEFFARLPDDHDGRRLERICDMCGKPVTGFGYFCEVNDRCLHPFCHIFPSSLEVDDRVVEFKLLDEDAALSSSKCLWCKKKRLEGCTVSGNIPGWFYVSTCNEYHFHVYCCNEMIMHENSLEKSIRGFLKTKRSTKAISSKKKNMSMSMMFVITNVVLELLSAVLDQVSSMNKLHWALFGMLISFAAMFTCIFELVFEARKRKLIWKWKDSLSVPWCYFGDQRVHKPFGSFKNLVGLVCAFCQCIVATIRYCFLRRHADNPIKISFFPIIFAFGLLFSQMLKNRERRNEVSEDDQIPLV